MSSAPTSNNSDFLAELARLVGSSHLLTDPAKPNATVKVSAPDRATRWRWCSLEPCWNCGAC